MTDTTFAMADTNTTIVPALEQFIHGEVVKQYHRSLVVERRRAIATHLDALGHDELDIVERVVRGLAQLAVGDELDGLGIVADVVHDLAQLASRPRS